MNTYVNPDVFIHADEAQELPVAQPPTAAQRDEIIRRARVMRAEAVADLLRRIARAIGRAFAAPVEPAPIATWRPVSLYEIERDAQMRRAEAAADTIVAVARFLKRLVREAVIEPLGRLRRRSLTLAALRDMGPATLRDIGIEPGEIVAVADVAYRREVEAAGGGFYGRFFAWIDATFVTPLRRWREAVRTRDELMALDDRILRDIGVERGEIPGLARAIAYGTVEAGAPIARRVAAPPRPPANVNEPRGFAAMLEAAD